MNKTLMEKSRCMLSGVRLGKELWVEAVVIACYLINRSPSLSVDEKTPHKVWIGNKHSLTHLKVFGCEAYVNVPNKNTSKLDKKAKNVYLLGIKMVSKVIIFGTQKLRRLCIVEIYYLGK
jgi:hypothetical protein